MNSRPSLTKKLDPDTFLNYYYLKSELVSFCRENNIASSGSKQELNNRLVHYFKTGEKLRKEITSSPKTRNKNKNFDIAIDKIIESDFTCTEKHRQFFKSVIGNKFTFNVDFQNYLKDKEEKKYSDAIEEWYKIKENKKQNKGSTTIDNQFEYNTYIRNFFSANKGKSLSDAIKCWKYKKNIKGHNKYEDNDLKILTDKRL